MLERDYATADKILTETALEEFPQAGDVPKAFYRGRVALARADIESAQRYFAAARPAMEKRVRDAPDNAQHHAELALLYAYMQRKEAAVREARRAVEIEPESQNAFHGAAWAANLALVSALIGEHDQAITLVERLLTTPGAVGSRVVVREILTVGLTFRDRGTSGGPSPSVAACPRGSCGAPSASRPFRRSRDTGRARAAWGPRRRRRPSPRSRAR